MIGYLLIMFRKVFSFNKLSVGLTRRLTMFLYIRTPNKGIINIGRRAHIRSGVKLISSGGKIYLGEYVFINFNTVITSLKKIEIGDGTAIGPNVVIVDHNHAFGRRKSERFTVDDIVIGKNCWIGANVTILKGTKLGDNCIVGANTVLKGEYESNTIITQDRKTIVKEIN